MLLVNKINYQTEEYSAKVLDKYMTYLNWPFKGTEDRNQNFLLRKSFLESEERYLGDGFFPRQLKWIEMIDQAKYNDGWSS